MSAREKLILSLLRAGPRSATELAGAARLDRATVVNTLRRLLASGAVKRIGRATRTRYALPDAVVARAPSRFNDGPITPRRQPSTNIEPAPASSWWVSHAGTDTGRESFYRAAGRREFRVDERRR